MKTRRFSLLILLALLWAGCAGQERPGPAAPATPAPTLAADRPALKPVLTATTVAAVVTETAPQPTPTTTLLPATATPEPAATPTPWPFEPPTGQIFFFYAPDPLDFEPHGEMDEYNLYRADATGDPGVWQITTILAQTAPMGEVRLSPDQSKLAFWITHDTNQDGRLTTGRIADHTDTFIYDRQQNAIWPLTNAEASGYVSSSIEWTSDNQVILMTNHNSEIVKTSPDGSYAETILTLTDIALGGVTLSADNQLLLYSIYYDPIAMNEDGLIAYNLQTQESTTLQENEGHLQILDYWHAWSPDGNWWAYRDSMGDTFVLNTNSLEFSPLLPEGEKGFVYGWSQDSRWLGVVKNWNSLLLWSPETLTITELLSGSEIKLPVWSPQANQIAVSVARDTADELLLVDAETGDLQTLLPAILERHIKPYSWSPDGNWLLLLVEEPEQSGLFILHPDSSDLFPVIDTTGGLLGYSHLWIPDLE